MVEACRVSGGLHSFGAGLNFEKSANCNLEMKPVAVILNDKELVRLLTHLGLPTEFPKFKPATQSSLYEHACGPPDQTTASRTRRLITKL